MENKQESVHQNHMRTCKHCHNRYDYRKAPHSALFLTYCCTICEMSDLGFTVQGLLESLIYNSEHRIVEETTPLAYLAQVASR